MNVETTLQSTENDCCLQLNGVTEEPVGLASTSRLEDFGQVFRRSAFPDVLPHLQPFDFGSFLTDARRRALLRDLKDTKLVIAAAGVCPDGADGEGDHQHEAVWNDLQNLSERSSNLLVYRH